MTVNAETGSLRNVSQGQQDLNPHLPVLETGARPVELYPKDATRFCLHTWPVHRTLCTSTWCGDRRQSGQRPSCHIRRGCSRDSRTRTCDLLLPKQVPWPLGYIPKCVAAVNMGRLQKRAPCTPPKSGGGSENRTSEVSVVFRIGCQKKLVKRGEHIGRGCVSSQRCPILKTPPAQVPAKNLCPLCTLCLWGTQ